MAITIDGVKYYSADEVDAKIAENGIEPDDSKLVAGDKATVKKVVGLYMEEFEVGDLVEVVESNPDYQGDIEFKRVADDCKGYAPKEILEKVEADDIEAYDPDAGFKVGDKVKITEGMRLGEVVTIKRLDEDGMPLVECEDGYRVYKNVYRMELIKSLGKDANGEDLYEGDLITGVEDNAYNQTTHKQLMSVEGEAQFPDGIFLRNIEVKIRKDIVRDASIGGEYSVLSTEFIKISEEEFDEKHKPKLELKVGDIVMVNERIIDGQGDLSDEGLAEVEEAFLADELFLISSRNHMGAFIEGNEDKLTLVCRAEDRLDLD